MVELAEALRSDIGAALAAQGIDCQIEPGFVVQISESPCIDIIQPPAARDSQSAAFGDITGFYALSVRARVTANDFQEMQGLLWDMNDDNHELSVAAAIEADQTLNGYTTHVHVDPDGFSGFEDHSTGTQQLVGCSWRVLIWLAVS